MLIFVVGYIVLLILVPIWIYGDLRYDKKVIFRNCTMKGIRNFGYFNKSDEGNKTYIEIHNSNIEIGSYGISFEGPYYTDGATSFIDVKVIDSTITSSSGSNLFTISQSYRIGTNFSL